MGKKEIQTAAKENDKGGTVYPRDSETEPKPICTLACRKAWKFLSNGSGVNREIHAPFCERPVGKFRRPTHHGYKNTVLSNFYEESL